MRHLALPGMLIAAALAAGCAQVGDLAAYHTRRIDLADRDAVLLEAGEILKREFGRVTFDRDAGRITTAPVVFDNARDSFRSADLVGARSTWRRVGVFVAEPVRDGTAARLRIDVEREDTTPRVAFDPPSDRWTDLPRHTAIQHDAATGAPQNVVWTRVRRDEPMERAILDELRNRLTPATEPAASPPAAQR
ncbi:MAG: hypothetical protein AB7Q17_00065 [Phycisphaerae bacterium]